MPAGCPAATAGSAWCPPTSPRCCCRSRSRCPTGGGPDPRAARRWPGAVLPGAVRPRRRPPTTPRWPTSSGTSSGRACSPTTPWRRCAPGSPAVARTAASRQRPRQGAQRPVRAHPAGPPRDAHPHRSADGGRALVAAARPGTERDPAHHRARRGAARTARRADPRRGRWPSRWPVASPPSTRCSGPSRRTTGPGAGTSSRRSAPPSSAPPARSTGCARFAAPDRVPGGAVGAGRHRPGQRLRRRAALAGAPRLPRRGPEADRRRGGHRSHPRRSGHRAGRKAGALVVLVDGELVLYVERGGKTLLSWTEDEHVLKEAATALSSAVAAGALGRMIVQKADGALGARVDAAVGRAAGRRVRGHTARPAPARLTHLRPLQGCSSRSRGPAEGPEREKDPGSRSVQRRGMQPAGEPAGSASA